MEILEERAREEFASIDYVKTGIVVEEVEHGATGRVWLVGDCVYLE